MGQRGNSWLCLLGALNRFHLFFAAPSSTTKNNKERWILTWKTPWSTTIWTPSKKWKGLQNKLTFSFLDKLSAWTLLEIQNLESKLIRCGSIVVLRSTVGLSKSLTRRMRESTSTRQCGLQVTLTLVRLETRITTIPDPFIVLRCSALRMYNLAVLNWMLHLSQIIWVRLVTNRPVILTFFHKVATQISWGLVTLVPHTKLVLQATKTLSKLSQSEVSLKTVCWLQNKHGLDKRLSKITQVILKRYGKMNKSVADLCSLSSWWS